MSTSERTLFIARLGLLLSFTLVIQMAGLPQPITGPLVNTVLFLATWMFGPLAGILIGSLTPLVALFRGQLPAILAPMVPFILAGNVSLVLIFYLIAKALREYSVIRWMLSLLSASAVKTLLLYGAVIFIVPHIAGERLPTPVEWMMSLPQFVTALIGGILTYLLVKVQPVLFSPVSSLVND